MIIVLILLLPEMNLVIMSSITISVILSVLLFNSSRTSKTTLTLVCKSFTFLRGICPAVSNLFSFKFQIEKPVQNVLTSNPSKYPSAPAILSYHDLDTTKNGVSESGL